MRLLTAFLLVSTACLAQSDDDDKDATAIVEIGGAASWNVDGGSSGGGDIAVEFTPIENWQEIEAGTTPVFARHTTEWDTEVLFKKPWTLSKRAELMAGLGPEWVHTRQFGVTRNSLAAEFAVDFMYWPGAKHKFGWFLEPAFDYTFGRGHERSLGMSAGLLIAIR